MNSDASQFLLFHINREGDAGEAVEESYALPMQAIREIIRVPDLNQVPLSGAHMIGLTNLRGVVLPVVSLRRLLEIGIEQTTFNSRILVLKGDSPIGLWVDSVDKVEEISDQRVDRSEVARLHGEHRLLDGFIRPQSDNKGALRRLLNVPALLKASKCRAVAGEDRLQNARSRQENAFQGSHDDTQQYICFSLGHQNYALNIRQVKEVVRLPAQPEGVSGMPAHLLGMLALRDLMVPMIQLSVLYGLDDGNAPAKQLDRSMRVIVVPIGSRDGSDFIGLVVDRINQVVSLPERSAQPVPEMLGRQPGFQDISAMIQPEGANQLTALLDVRKLLSQQVFQQAVNILAEAEINMIEQAEQQADISQTGERQIVVFKLDDEEYGIEIEATKEILRVPKSLTRVPQAEGSIEGIVNLRGMVLPVVDLRKRFGLGSVQRHHSQRIVVLNLAGQRTGFIVDAVREVLKITSTDIESAPPLSPEQDSLVTEIANMSKHKRMVLLIDVNRLVNEQKHIQLANLTEQTATD